MRTLFRGGRVFDGTCAPHASADLVIDDGRIVAVGSGLDGDEAIECESKSLLPGLFDCHINLMGRYEETSSRSPTGPSPTPSTWRPPTFGRPSRSGSRRCATPEGPTSV